MLYSASVTSELTVKPTTSETGLRTYTASFGRHSDTIEIVIPLLPEEAPDTPEGSPVISIDSKPAPIGGTVQVNVRLKNNPGITSLKLELHYSDSLTLKNVEFGNDIGGQTVEPLISRSGLVLNWINGENNTYGDFVFASLIFNVSQNAVPGSTAEITATYDPMDVFDVSNTDIVFYIQKGILNFESYIPGDITADGEINNKDVTRLLQYVTGWEVEASQPALDVNSDGYINNKDVTRLLQYVSGWDVDIY